jgi:putative colanic acid biosynthesis acetyltransferase WcaB
MVRIFLRLLIFSKYRCISKNFLVRGFYKLVLNLVAFMLGIDLHWSTVIGTGLTIHHGFGLVVHKNTVLGDNVTLRNGVVLGVKEKGCDLAPVVGDNVEFGAHVIVIGNVVVGSDSVIGAGSVVLNDIGPNQVWVGNPARRIN